MGVLWGLKPGTNDRLRPGSNYGEGLSALCTLVAVGSAVHSRRYSSAVAAGGPEWRQFEIPAIVRSYFDPLIVCGVLRWLQPEECWWGREASTSGQVILEFIRGYQDIAEQRVVVSELLLASAMGKVPVSAVRTVVSEAERLISDPRMEYGRDVLQFGIDVCEAEVIG